MNDQEKPDDRDIARMLGNPEGELGLRVAERMNSSNQHIIRRTMDALSLQPGESVMEIGFGNGAHINELLSLASEIMYTGVDISETMIQQAKINTQEAVKAGKVSFVHASAEAMPFAPNTFDKIFTVNTLYFWKDPQKTLAEIKRVLKPEGRFCLAIKSRSFMQHLPFTRYGFTMYEQSEAEDLLKSAGFKIGQSQYHQEQRIDLDGLSLVPDAIIIEAEKY